MIMPSFPLSLSPRRPYSLQPQASTGMPTATAVFFTKLCSLLQNGRRNVLLLTPQNRATSPSHSEQPFLRSLSERDLGSRDYVLQHHFSDTRRRYRTTTSSSFSVHNRDHSDSAGSSLTVQIGLRMSYTIHVPDPIEALPPSITSLSIAPRTASFADHNNWSDTASTRLSASTENVNSLTAHTSKIEVLMPYETFLAPLAFMSDLAEHKRRNPMLQQPRVQTELFALAQHALNASRPTPAIRQPFLPNPEPGAAPNSNVHLDASHEQLQYLRPAFKFTSATFPLPAVNRLYWTANTRSIEGGFAEFKPESAIPTKKFITCTKLAPARFDCPN